MYIAALHPNPDVLGRFLPVLVLGLPLDAIHTVRCSGWYEYQPGEDPVEPSQ